MKRSAGTALSLFADVAHPHSHIGAPDLPPLHPLVAGEARSGQYTGLKALMLAVLEEAIRNYLGADARLRSDAAYWIACNGHRSPFAFATVCETLGLAPAAVRNALQRLREKNATFCEEIGRSRPNVRHSGRLLMPKNRLRSTHVTAARTGNGATR